MSAYLVSAENIDALVAGARQYLDRPGTTATWYTDAGTRYEFRLGVSDSETADGVYNKNTLGRMLWAENLASINYRYPDTIENPDNMPGPIGVGLPEIMAYEYGPGFRSVNVDPLGLIGVIRGYEYQSCEHPGWHTSAARAFCQRLTDAVVHELIERTGANGWTIDSLADIEGYYGGTATPAGGWTLSFRPNVSRAVSISEMIR